MNMELDYTYNDENDPNRFYYRSDHYNFAKNNIPVIFYFNGVHPDYHKPTDTAEKIEYEALKKRAQLVFLTAWEIANRDERLVVDKAEE
jgi:Zn-dependent M28 family amino/carboxypeptidase